MSEQTEQTTPGMALMEVAGDSMELRAKAFEQLTEYRRSSVLRSAAQSIAATGWGKNISVDMRRDVARYALSVGTDPVRHWEIMGGRLYDKAELWMDLATAQDDFDGYTHEFVHDDDRLSDEDRTLRKQMRAKHGVPEDVKGACVVWIYRAGRSLPSIGVNWAGNRKCYVAAQKKEGTKLDPIGEQEPSKTAFTRAFRRAAKVAFPLYFRRTKKLEREEGVPLTALDHTEQALQAERLEAKAQNAALPPQATYVKPIDVPQLPSQPANTMKPIEGYSRETNTERETEKPPTTEPVEAAEDTETPSDQAELEADARLDD